MSAPSTTSTSSGSATAYGKLIARIVRRRHCPESFAKGVELALMQRGEHEAAHLIRVARFMTFHPNPMGRAA